MPFPNPEQSAVIQHREEPLIVVAGPGTGKTRTLVERMINLLTEDQSREVTFITFTRSSRRDTEKKLMDAFGESVLDQPDIMFPRTSTLHTYAKQIVHRYAPIISREPSFSILVESKSEKNLLLDEIIADLSLNIDLATLSESIKCQRATTNWPSGFSLGTSERVATLGRYELLLAVYQTFDMEGVVLAACQILESGGAELPRLFLQVDEYQDLNQMDQRFIDLAASHPLSEVVVVGDDAQSIYGFRHAHPEGVRSLWNSPDWVRIRFGDSFRLPAHILNAALDLISAANYAGSGINRKTPNNKLILTLQCTTPDLQIEAVARHISELVGKATRNDGSPIRYSDLLVLCPTGTYAQRAADLLANSYAIPAHMPSRGSISDELWNVILLLRILQHNDPLALRQCLPILGLTSDEIRRIRDEAIAGSLPFFDHCFSINDERMARFQECLYQLRMSVDDSESFFQHLGLFDGVRVPEDFVGIVNSVLQDDGRLPSLDRLIQIIYRRFGVLEEDDVISDENRVLVTTMHSAKGLEAEFVYCLWLNSRYMPLPNRDGIQTKSEGSCMLL